MKMEYNGCHFDASSHWLLTEQIKKDLEAAEARLKAAVGPHVSLTSNKQLSDHYKKVLDPKTLKKWPRTEKGDDLCLISMRSYNSPTSKLSAHWLDISASRHWFKISGVS